MQLSRYIKIYHCEEAPDYLLFYSTKRASKVLLHESVLREIEEDNLSPSDEETLASLGFLVRDGHEEKKELLNLVKEADKQRHFNAIAVLNLDCNLACKYCFEGKMKGRQFMSTDTAEMFVEFAKKYLDRGKSINIDFYGGEPLLSLDTIKFVSKKLKKAAEEKGLRYTFRLITNGTLLTKERIEPLLPLGLKSAKITLDGPKESHDIYRPFKSGAGSFDTIIRNTIDVCRIIDIQIGGNYTRDNYKGFPGLLDYLIERGLTPDIIPVIKFDPVTRAVKDFALPDFRDGVESINEPWIIEASIYLREEILKRGFDTYKIVPSRCAIEFKDDVIIGHDGTLYKCPAFMGLKGFEAGTLKTGIKDCTKSYNLSLWKTDKCFNCEYLPVCFGGCRFMKLLRDGKIDDVDCKKAYFDATMETFIKQDIKYQANTRH